MQKEEEFYYRRPIFSCKENGKVLFYHEKRCGKGMQQSAAQGIVAERCQSGLTGVMH